MNDSPDDRSAIAIAYQWAWRVTTISLEMVLPGAAGIWVDRQLGSTPLLTVIGFSLGMALGMWSLVRLASRQGDSHTKKKE